MRQLIELHEEINEVNYFLREWQRLRTHPTDNGSILAQPELRFISRTIEHLINEAQAIDRPLVLKVERSRKRTATSLKQNNPLFTESNTAPSRDSIIELTEYLKTTNKKGDRISYVGNKHGLLSLSKLADMVADGSTLELKGMKHVVD